MSSDDCGQNGVCSEAPGCSRHWAERVREVMAERDEARRDLGEILAVIHRDGGHHTSPRRPSDACWRMEQEFLQRKLAGEAAHIKSLEGLLVDAVRERDKVIEERERARQACNAYWHDLTRIALLCAQTDDEYPLKAVERTVRERDEARAEVSRREREHEALVETAQKALAHVASERDALQAKLDAELPAMWREDLASLNECLERAWRERDEARVDVERLRHERRQLRALAEQLRRERRQLRARLVECRPWVGACPYPNTPGFNEVMAIRGLADDTLEEVK